MKISKGLAAIFGTLMMLGTSSATIVEASGRGATSYDKELWERGVAEQREAMEQRKAMEQREASRAHAALSEAINTLREARERANVNNPWEEPNNYENIICGFDYQSPESLWREVQERRKAKHARTQREAQERMVARKKAAYERLAEEERAATSCNLDSHCADLAAQKGNP
jgi:hypothetical protein